MSDKKSFEIPRLDYSQFKEIGPGTKRDKAKRVFANPNRWWLASDEDLPGAVMSQVGLIIQADRGRIDSYNQYAKLYGTYTPTFWNGYQLANSGKTSAPSRDRLTYNIVQSCIDTLTSLVAINKPKPMFLTNQGDSKVQRRAKKLDQFCYGLFYENDAYKKGIKGFRDSAVFGDGYIHPYDNFGRVAYERVLPYELLTDYLESHYGEESTKSVHRIKNIDRMELAEMYPDQADAIMRMAGTSVFISAANRSVADTVTVVESHRLRNGSKPGMHCVVTPEVTLIREVYDKDYFPYARQQFSDRLYGYYSQGMAEQLVPLQLEINRTLISIQRSLYLGGTHKIMMKTGSKVIKSHFDNLIGTIIEYAGDTAPQYVVPQLVQPEIYNHLQDMIQKGYQLPGISQMAATSQKSPGVNSGRAMRTEQDMHTQRFTSTTDMYNQFFVDLAKLSVSVARDIYKEYGKLSVKVPGKRFIQTIDWSEVSLEDDEFCLQIFPISKLPTDPEGRIQTITELVQGGLLEPEVGQRLLDFPDLEAEEALAVASQDYLHMILDKMVEGNGDDEDYTAPEPFDDLVRAKKLALEYYAKEKLTDVKPDSKMAVTQEKKLELLRKFMQQVDDLTSPQQAPMPPAQPVPQANPQPTPTSDLIPNVNQAA